MFSTLHVMMWERGGSTEKEEMEKRERNVLFCERLIFVSAHYLYWLGGYFKDCSSTYVQKLPSFYYKSSDYKSYSDCYSFWFQRYIHLCQMKYQYYCFPQDVTFCWRDWHLLKKNKQRNQINRSPNDLEQV